MTIADFAEAIVYIRRKYSGSVTSWGRTDRHAVDVGGFVGDPHTWDLGVDMVYHVVPDLGKLAADAAAHGLKVLRETGSPHDHYQPADMPAGSLTDYNGEHKTWA